MTISKDTLEQLSEFVDGQAKRETGMFFAKRLSADSELQAVWSRYHLIRECVRHRGAHAQAMHLQNRVATAIASEPEPEPGIEPLRVQPAWFRPVIGLAITAVVAITAVIAVQNSENQPGTVSAFQSADTPTVSFSTPENNGLGPVTNRAVPVSYTSSASRNDQRLNAYLLRHNQVVSRTGRGGVIYLAPIVAAYNSSASGQPGPPQDQAEKLTADIADNPKELPESPAAK